MRHMQKNVHMVAKKASTAKKNGPLRVTWTQMWVDLVSAHTENTTGPGPLAVNNGCGRLRSLSSHWLWGTKYSSDPNEYGC